MKNTTVRFHLPFKQIVATAAVLCLGSLAIVQPALAQLQVALQKIGNPIWKPVDFHLFGAEVGFPGNEFAEYFENLQKILPPPNHQWHPELSLGPGTPHAGPYDHELAAGIAAAGFLETTNFHKSDFKFPNAVWMMWMNVPDAGAPTGKTVDAANGPMIPNSVFPIHLAWDVFHDGVQDGATSTYDRPPLPEVNPPFDVEGDSHYPQFLIFTEPDKKFTKGKAVTWEHRATLTDAQGNGWVISAKFQVNSKN